ncbi:MAG: DUF2252 family protein [Solirubrobacteraceae bacterium]
MEEQAPSRVPELVPIRYGRMLVSPFTFHRGAAYLMAADLERSPRTALGVQLCGDAVTITAYLGKSDALDQPLADFAELYADQNELDYAALNAAVKTGRVKPQTGL